VTRRNRNRRGASTRPPLAALLGLGVLIALAVALPARAATPAQIVLLDTAPAFSPQVTVNLPGGGVSGLTAPGQFQLQVTPSGGTPTLRQGFCVDTLNPIGENTPYSVSLQTAADDPSLGSPAAGEAAWLMQEANAMIAASANPGLEAGAIQTAIWMILGEANPVTPTSDPTLNARAQQVRALAAGRKPAGPVDISATDSSTCAGGAGTTLTVTGTPGASASLDVTEGRATLSDSRVTFNAAGTATVRLTSSSTGLVRVTVTSNGSELTRATRLAGAGAEPQETGFMTSRTYSASVTVAFTACLTPAGARAPALTITKSAPTSLRSGSRVPYTITVSNRSKTMATKVVVADTLPSGMSYRASSKRPHQLGRKIVWRLGNLKPGAKRTMKIVLQSPSGLVGTRTNTVVVTAQGRPAASAKTTTRFTRVSQQRTPAVTG
jgi:uncharacterized repeat protein (TIGR01451 family)